MGVLGGQGLPGADAHELGRGSRGGGSGESPSRRGRGGSSLRGLGEGSDRLRRAPGKWSASLQDSGAQERMGEASPRPPHRHRLGGELNYGIILPAPQLALEKV